MSSGLIDVREVSRTIRIILQVRQVVDRRAWFTMSNEATKARSRRDWQNAKGALTMTRGAIAEVESIIRPARP